METKHTPTPWEVYGPNVQGLQLRYKQVNVAFIPEPLSEVDVANAAYIVLAVNAHEELLACLKDALLGANSVTMETERWKQAIAKAEGK